MIGFGLGERAFRLAPLIAAGSANGKSGIRMVIDQHGIRMMIDQHRMVIDRH
jgi:hypothetical protein